MAAGLLLLFGLELAVELWRTGLSWSDLVVTPDQTPALASTVSRALNNLTAMVLTFIALAVPLTANMYTPKLIEIFVRDKINLAAMVFFAAMGAHAVFGQAMMFKQWSPVVMYSVLWISGVVGFAVLVPYYVYVLHCLNPATIVRRLSDLVLKELRDAAAPTRPLPLARKRLDQLIQNLGNVILRATERADRDVSLHAVYALQATVMRYADAAPDLPAAWFEAERELFPGASPEALEHIVREKIWVEQRCLHQLALAYTSSLARMPDAISAISSVIRSIAEHALARGDEPLLRLCVRYFNTYLREAIKKKDVHAIYDVYGQYGALALRCLKGAPHIATAIARHVKYYAEFARWQGLAFIFEVAAHDLVDLVDAAYEAGTANREDLLAVFLSFKADRASPRLVKSQALLAACVGSHGATDAEARVVEALRAAGPDQLRAAREQIEAATDPVFWEVTDRQRNLDYVEPVHRPRVLEALDRALA